MKKRTESTFSLYKRLSKVSLMYVDVELEEAEFQPCF